MMQKIKEYKFYDMYKNIIQFEICYKILTLFILSPILRRILREYLDRVSYGIAFNQDIIYQFLSWQGIVVALLLFLFMILIIFYELYVVIQILALGEKNKEFSLRQLLLKSFGNLKSLHYPSLLICGIYIVLLLPLVHVGYLNSYIPRWEIPPFIFGELKLTTLGNMLIVLIYLVYYSLFLLMIFVPIFMVLKRQSIIKAIKESFCLLKTITMYDRLKLFSIIVVWIIIEYFIMKILPYPILHNRDFNWYFIKYIINSAAFRYSAIQYILFYLLSLMAMIAFIRYIIMLVKKYDVELITVNEIPIDTDQLNKWVYQIQNFCKELYQNIKMKMKHFGFYQKHKRITQGILVILVICLMSLYLQQDALVHKPWVIGHRGSGYYVENSFEAVQDANMNGADFAEIDIQLSKDNVPMVFHDASLSRLSDVNKAISDLTAQELETISIYEKNHESHIISLEHLIEKMREEKMKVGLLIELKPSGDNSQQMVHKIIEIIEKYQFSKQAIFMSLDYKSVSLLNQLKPEWWVGYCIFGSVGDIDDSIWDMNIDFLAMEENRASTSMIQKAVSHMIPIYIWTVDNSKKMKQYLDMGVCGLITNYPDIAKKVIDDYQKKHFQYYYYDGKGYPQFSWS